jgi:hypothetical protein
MFVGGFNAKALAPTVAFSFGVLLAAQSGSPGAGAFLLVFYIPAVIFAVFRS